MSDISRRSLLAASAALPLAGAATAQTTPSQSGIQEAVLSVFGFDRIAQPMVEVGGYRRVALPPAPAAQWPAWKVPAACSHIEQTLLLPPTGERGGLRLVRFVGAPQRVMRSSARSWDTGGIFDVDVFSTDVSAAYSKLQTYGWSGMGDPVDYSEAQFSVRQVVAAAPDGFMLAMIQRYSPPVTDVAPFGAMSPVFNSTQMVADLDRALKFYVDGLGFTVGVRFDITDQDEPGVDVLGLPRPQAKTAVRRLAMLRLGKVNPAAIELIENQTMRGKDFSAACVAPNVGLLSLRIPVADAAAYAAEIKGRGVTLYAEPSRFEVAPYGPVTIFAVRSPEGAILEFFDRG